MKEFKEHLEDLLSILRQERGNVNAHQAVLAELLKLLIERERIAQGGWE